MIFRLILLSILCIALILPSSAKAQTESLSLEQYLHHVMASSEMMKAIDLDIQSLRMEIQARDIELSPIVGINLIRFWDDRPSLSSNRQLSGKSAELLLSKPFATGTNVNLSSYLENADYSTTSDDQNLLNWQIGLSQSLWQNMFGRQTSLRRQRDQDEQKSRLLTLMLQQQHVLIDFESLYWDITYAFQEVRIRQENLERSQRIFEWIEERFGRSAAEHIDLLQGKTLVSSRELQLQVASDNLKTLQARLAARLSIDPGFTPVLDDLKKERDILSLPAKVSFAATTPVLIDALQAHYETDYLKTKSKYEADKLKPDLEVGYIYGKQGIDPSFSTARHQAFANSDDYHQIGVVFSMPLDFGLIRTSRLANEAAYKAQEMRANQFKRQSSIQWDDLLRSIDEQKQRIVTALDLAKLQNEKSHEERSRYEKGKTTAFQAISFEQEAAESDLLVLQLMTQLRRLESQARIYIQKTDDIQ